MSTRVVALVGVSGVGKSTLLRKIEGKVSFLHLQASQLIKDEIAQITVAKPTSEQLRNGPVIDNQALLVSAFRRKTSTHSGLIVLDGHTIVDTPEGLVEIPAAVFAEMNVTHFIVLHDFPGLISERRQADKYRKRPGRTDDELIDHQWRSLAAAARIALKSWMPPLPLNI